LHATVAASAGPAATASPSRTRLVREICIPDCASLARDSLVDDLNRCAVERRT
jgi:hypothetical protein